MGAPRLLDDSSNNTGSHGRLRENSPLFAPTGHGIWRQICVSIANAFRRLARCERSRVGDAAVKVCNVVVSKTIATSKPSVERQLGTLGKGQC